MSDWAEKLVDALLSRIERNSTEFREERFVGVGLTGEDRIRDDCLAIIRSHAPVIDKCGCCEGVRSKLGQIIEFGPDAAWHIYLERAYRMACRGAGVEPPSIESLMKQMAAWPQYNAPDADKVAEEKCRELVKGEK